MLETLLPCRRTRVAANPGPGPAPSQAVDRYRVADPGRTHAYPVPRAGLPGYHIDAQAMGPAGALPDASAPLDLLRQASPEGFAEVTRYINLAADGMVGPGDVDALLNRLRASSAPLERGIVGPTGASATISMSVLGPVFGLYGFYAGCQIVARSGHARSYLRKVDQEIERRKTALSTLHPSVEHPETLQHNALALEQRIDALEAFRTGVRNSLREQTFNQAFPGLVQLSASALILALAVELAPTLGGGTALLGHAATAALSISAAGVLGIYAAGSLVKNVAGLAQACRTRKLCKMAGDDATERAYIADFNRSVGVDRLFYSLNSVSWGVYVGGCVSLILIASGAGLSHGAAVGAVVGGALAAVVWDALWGERVGPHNALTPHVDRSYITTWNKRVRTWNLLEQERKQLRHLIADILEDLPGGRQKGFFGPMKVWQNVSKKHRYNGLYKHIPKLGGIRRLARWGAHDVAHVDVKLRDYMLQYTRLEIDYLQHKLQDKYRGLLQRRQEFTGIDDKPATLQKLLELWQADLATIGEEHARLAALNGLHAELSRLDMGAVRRQDKPTADWHRARLGFMSVNGYLPFFVTRHMVLEHPQWFRNDIRTTRILHRPKVDNIRLSLAGYDALVSRGFTQKDERRFIEAIVNPRNNTYEMDVVRQLEKAERRHGGKRALEDQQRQLGSSASTAGVRQVG